MNPPPRYKSIAWITISIAPRFATHFAADVLKGVYPMLFTVGAGRNSSPWYQPSVRALYTFVVHAVILGGRLPGTTDISDNVSSQCHHDESHYSG